MPNRGLNPSHWVLLCGVLATASCQYSGGYVTTLEDVGVVVSVTPTTAVYESGKRPGEFVRKSFEGKASTAIHGGERFDLEAEPVRSAQAIAQPFSGERVGFQRTKDGKVGWQLDGKTVCRLSFVTGSWAQYEAGEEVVLRLDKASWERWAEVSQAATRRVVDGVRRRMRSRLHDDQSVTAARVVDMLVDEKPLIRLSRRRAYVFFEAVDVEGGFAVETRRRKSRYSWWSYELRPEVKDFAVGVGVFTAHLAVEVAMRCVEIGCRR